MFLRQLFLFWLLTFVQFFKATKTIIGGGTHEGTPVCRDTQLEKHWDTDQSCKRAHFEAQTRPEPDIYFEARFRPESQIYRVGQGMRNCGVSKNVVYGCSCRYTVSSHSKWQSLWPKLWLYFFIKRKLSVLDNVDTAECNVSQVKKEMSWNYSQWRYRHKKNYLV